MVNFCTISLLKIISVNWFCWKDIVKMSGGFGHKRHERVNIMFLTCKFCTLYVRWRCRYIEHNDPSSGYCIFRGRWRGWLGIMILVPDIVFSDGDGETG